MTQRQGGFRAKTRHKLRKRPRERGKVTISRMLKLFNIGDKVRVMHEPAMHKGMPHPRFKNLTGTIHKKQGKAYLVQIKVGTKLKSVLAKAVHLVKV